VLRNIPLSIGAGMGLLFGVVLFGTTFSLPQLTQRLLRYPAYQAGLVLLPRAITLFLAMPLVGWLFNYVDARLLIAVGIGLTYLAFHQLAHLSLNVGFWNLVPIMLIMGAGLPCMFVTLSTTSLSTVRREDMTAATSLYTLARRVGGNLGYALVATLVERFSVIHQAHLSAHMSNLNSAYSSYYATLAARLARQTGDPVAAQGKALDKVASRNVKVLVVGNPANTNAYIAMKSAPSLPRKNFTAMLRLDHNRAASQIAAKTGTAVGDIEKLTVWGNHSPTMYADYRFATVGGKSVKDLINDQVWNADVFLPTVGKRGAAIIEARGLSSAASAANAAIDHMRDWALGSNGKWVTMGIPSDGQYGIPKDVIFGFPVTTENGEYKLVEGLEIDAFSQERINKTLEELEGERAGVAHLL